jgi:hypothetical protein
MGLQLFLRWNRWITFILQLQKEQKSQKSADHQNFILRTTLLIKFNQRKFCIDHTLYEMEASSL